MGRDMVCSKCGEKLPEGFQICYVCKSHAVTLEEKMKMDEETEKTVNISDKVALKSKKSTDIPALTGVNAFANNLAAFILLAGAYVLFMAMVSTFGERNIGSSIVIAVIAIVLWLLGIVFFTRANGNNPVRNRYAMILLLAIVVFIYALILNSYGQDGGYVVGLVISGFNLLWAIGGFKDTKNELSDHDLASNQPKPIIKTEDERAGDLVKMGYQYVHRMEQLKSYIQNDKITNAVTNIETISRQILRFIETHPKHSGKLNKLVEYYFPTAIKLLENYDVFDQKPIKGENVQEVLGKISQGLISLEKALEQLLNNLYADKVMDIDAEVTILQQTIAIEGLNSEDPFALK